MFYKAAKINEVSIHLRCSVLAGCTGCAVNHDAAAVAIYLLAEQGDPGVLYLD
jgi:hypothetical protein